MRGDFSDGEDDGEHLSEQVCGTCQIKAALFKEKRWHDLEGRGKCCCWKLLPNSGTLGWTSWPQGSFFPAVPSSSRRRGEDIGCKTLWFSFGSFSAERRTEARDQVSCGCASIRISGGSCLWAGLHVFEDRRVSRADCRESVNALRMISASRGREKVFDGKASGQRVFSMTGLHETVTIPSIVPLWKFVPNLNLRCLSQRRPQNVVESGVQRLDGHWIPPTRLVIVFFLRCSKSMVFSLWVRLSPRRSDIGEKPVETKDAGA